MEERLHQHSSSRRRDKGCLATRRTRQHFKCAPLFERDLSALTRRLLDIARSQSEPTEEPCENSFSLLQILVDLSQILFFPPFSFTGITVFSHRLWTAGTVFISSHTVCTEFMMQRITRRTEVHFRVNDKFPPAFPAAVWTCLISLQRGRSVCEVTHGWSRALAPPEGMFSPDKRDMLTFFTGQSWPSEGPTSVTGQRVHSFTTSERG